MFGLGNFHSAALQLADRLAAECEADVAVVNPRFTKPLDAPLHELFGQAADLVVTLEDHAVTGGYGSAVLELFQDKNILTPVIRIGWPDRFIEHASTVEELRQNHGLGLDQIFERIQQALEADLPVPRERTALSAT